MARKTEEKVQWQKVSYIEVQIQFIEKWTSQVVKEKWRAELSLKLWSAENHLSHVMQ